jgi:D-3-phosphoglycerate dehydrogenase
LLQVTGPFDEGIVPVLPSSVKYICHNGAGYDNIDVEACTTRGISVSHTPDINIYAVADTTMYLMIGAMRQITAVGDALRRGRLLTPISTKHSNLLSLPRRMERRQ